MKITATDWRSGKAEPVRIALQSNSWQVGKTNETAANMLLLPSFVDMYAVLRQQSELRTARKNGITHILAMPGSIASNEEIHMPALYKTATLTRHSLPRDYHALQHSGATAVLASADDLLHSKLLQRCLQLVKETTLKVIIQPDWLPLSRHGQAHQGAHAVRKGLDPIPAVAESIALHIIGEMVKHTGCPIHCTGISAARSVEILANQKKQGLPITADTPITHLLHCDEDIGEFDTRFKLFPPLRSRADQAALRDGVRAGVIDAITSHHIAHKKTDKQLPFASAAFGCEVYNDFLRFIALLITAKIPLEQIVYSCSQAPAQILGIANSDALICQGVEKVQYICSENAVLALD